MGFRSYELILIGGNGSLTSYAVSSVYGYQLQHTFNFIQILGASLLTSVTSCSDPAYIITSSDIQNKLVSYKLFNYMHSKVNLKFSYWDILSLY